ncbi:MAG: haloacid dehalogenase-like hydrolase [Synergistaceae bacterium]|nr:haloacid dehalogenase-like hydrolase [Synergistaceae bacterium]
MMRKFLSALIIVLSFAGLACAMSVEDIASISVKADGSDFKYWNEDSKSFQALKAYVEDVTNPESPNFIPVEDRICVSDMDGTIYGELAPIYMEWYLFFHRVFDDDTYTPNPRVFAFAQEALKAAKAGNISTAIDAGEDSAQSYAFDGMTVEEFDAYAENFINNTPLDGLSNCKFSEAYYLPMVEVIKYLQANGFSFYVVTAADRQLMRVALRGAIPSISPANVIGTDSLPLARRQGFTDGLYFEFKQDDVVVRGPYLVTNNKMNKVSSIYKEIGKRPVMGLGNSGSDSSMLNYAIFNPKYKGFAMGVCADDETRDYGNAKKAQGYKSTCEKFGWVPISMRDDWKTIYGDGVEKTEQKFRQ